MHTNPKSLSIIEFERLFPDPFHCFNALAQIKWKHGFRCIKCGHNKYCRGKYRLDRQCSKCRYIESPTANTIFHGIKFSIKKAFYIAYFTVTQKKGVSSTELSRKLDLRQKTCWLFRRKVLTAMKQNRQNMDPKRTVQLGILFTGKKGRKHALKKKKQSLIAIQVEGNKLFSIKAKVLKNRGKKDIAQFIQQYFDTNVYIKSDQWPGARAAMKSFENAHLFKTKDAKKELRLLYRTRMMLLGWLRGTHGHAKDVQAYLDEYCFRMNYRYLGGVIFFFLLNRLIDERPITYKQLTGHYSNA